MDTHIHLCCACGTSFDTGTQESPPPRCPICDEERQYVPEAGQRWISSADLAKGHANTWREAEPRLLEIRTSPKFGIGQRAFLLRTPHGNILWDCIALLDAATEQIVRALGGISAIAVSHPHYYTTMQHWACAFNAPVWLHAKDREWVMREDAEHLRFWEGDTHPLGEKTGDVTLLRVGGHFPGGTVLHWAGGADGRGVLLSGDIVQVVADTRRVSFMWSYPNLLPLSASTVRRIGAALEPWAFDRIYGAFAGKQVIGDAGQVVARSVARYAELLESDQA